MVNGRRALWITSLALLLMGCPGPQSRAVLANGAPWSITVRYALDAAGAQGRCPFEALEQVPRLTRASRSGLRRPQDWQPLEPTRVDLQRCEMEFRLAPGFAASLFDGGFCADDYDTYRARSDLRPPIRFLEIESATGLERYTSWQVVRRFARRNGDLCVFRYR